MMRSYDSSSPEIQPLSETVIAMPRISTPSLLDLLPLTSPFPYLADDELIGQFTSRSDVIVPTPSTVGSKEVTMDDDTSREGTGSSIREPHDIHIGLSTVGHKPADLRQTRGRRPLPTGLATYRRAIRGPLPPSNRRPRLVSPAEFLRSRY